MEKSKMNAYYPVVVIFLLIMVIAGSFFVYHANLLPEDLRQPQQQNPGQILQPTPAIPTSAGPAYPAVPVGTTQDPGSECNPTMVAPHIPVPVDTSIPIRDPMPGIRFSLNETDSDKTIVLGKGDVFEINLMWRPGQPFRWIIPISGCGLDLVNDGYSSEGVDLLTTSGNYRARYRAISPGTSVLHGKYVLTPEEDGIFWFNLTVIVK